MEAHMSLIGCRQVDDERKVQEIAIDWHGGQWSALYMIACGNLRKMSIDDLRRAEREIDTDIYACESTERNRLLTLRQAIGAEIKRRGAK
jgi:hypothetical protein